MTFPVPRVSGVFLSLPPRVSGAVTDGSATHYLLDGRPRRLRNHLGFHAAVAEFVDALLERAVIPYQTTQSLPSLSVLPTADFPGCGHTPTLYAPVSFEPAIADSEKRAMLGHEKRLAPLEFWRAMFLGSDRLARVCNPVPFTNGVLDEGSGSDSDDEPDVLIYPSVLCPRQGVKERSWGETYAYGFYDLVDTGWCETDTFPDEWSPSEFGTSFAPTSVRYLGRAALEVFSTVDFPDFGTWAGASLPMVAGLAGFRMVAGERGYGRAIWPWQNSEGSRVTIHGGYQFTGKFATIEYFDWEHKPYGPTEEIISSPYNFDFVGDIAFPRMQLAAAKAYNGLSGEEPSPDPWVSPYYYRHIKTTARANLDVLRIQQVLLGLFWANWARMPVVVKVPHVAEKVVRTWHVDEYGRVGGPYDTPVQGYPKTCSDLSVDQECRWRLSLDPDPEYSRCYGCSGQFYYEIPFFYHSNSGHESTVESYPYLDGLDAGGVGLSRAEVQRIVDDAGARKQQAEQDKAAAEQAKAAAELYLSGGGVADLAASLAAAMQGGSYWTDGSTARYRRPDDHVWVFDCGFDLMVDGRVWSGGFIQVADVFRAPNPNDDSIPGEFLLQESAQSLFSSAVFYADTGSPPPSGSFSIRVRGSSPVLDIGAQGISDALRGRRQAEQDIAEAEGRIATESETVEFGVPVDIGPELFRRILSRHDNLLETWVVDDCDTDSGNLLVAGMRWLAAHGDLSGWEPRDPQGGFDYSETAYRMAPVLDSESCPVRVYLAHLLTEGVSPWPAESVIDAEYVKAETVALGMTMLDEAQGAHMGQYGGIEFDFDDDDPKPFCRRVAMSDAPEPGVSAPADTIRGILAALVANFPDLPMRAASAVSNARFDRLLFAEPQFVRGAPDFGWNVRPAYAWYHPDRGPDPASQYQWLDPDKLWPYRVTGEQPDGTVSECSLENGDFFLFYLVVDAYFSWCSLIVTPPLGFHDQMTLRIGEHAAVRSEWNWKSMPVEQ